MAEKDTGKDRVPTGGTKAWDPREYMRTAHPDLFSDSEIRAVPALARETFEYFLSKITTQNRESEFAHFCRKLAEREICPTLRPQTGPIGGGDSKADSESIPVSSEISRVWVGADPQAGDERWAFAFSAMKDWKRKARSDVEGVVAKERGYSRIYFVTNQWARDKDRADLEDELHTKYGIQVYILDGNWITTSVFDHDHIQIAIDTLHIDQASIKPEKRTGPRDLKREQDLAKLDADISDQSLYRGVEYQLAEDCLSAALLARALERPRTIVDGYFTRAARVADQVGQRQQRLRVAYNYAWTALWWYDDVALLNSLYDTVEQFACGSSQADDIELLQNLWQLLVGSIARGLLTQETAKLSARETRLRSELFRLAAESHRPNNALQAEVGLALMRLNDAYRRQSHDEIKGVWRELRGAVGKAERLGDFPFDRFANVVRSLGRFTVDDDEFDHLFDDVVKALESRESEAAGGLALLERAYQKGKAHKLYDAIVLFGRAQERLTKREYRDELISALAGASIAYEQVDLLWAARTSALSATERCLAYFHEGGTIVRPSVTCIQRLIWIELQLGRITHVIELIHLSDLLIPNVELSEQRLQSHGKERELQELILGILLLRSTLGQLHEMELLPDALEQRNLFFAKGALLYALGYRDELRNEGFSRDRFSDAEIDDFMQKWIQQPASAQVPLVPMTHSENPIRLTSTVLGCEVVLQVGNDPVSIFFAEALLGALEAFLATSMSKRIMPFRSTLNVVVSSRSDDPELVMTEDVCDGETILRLFPPGAERTQTPEIRQANQDNLRKAVLKILTMIAMIPEPESFMDEVAGEESGFGRAFSFSEIAISTENVFGGPLSISKITQGVQARSFAPTRDREWFSDLNVAPLGEADAKLDYEAGTGTPTEAFRAEFERASHKERRVFSLIDIPLWDKARWGATLYVQDPRQDPPLLLGLGFREPEAAKEIFSGLQHKVGKTDSADQLRVAIITGIDKTNPAAYSVLIGSNIRFTDQNRFAVSVSRINQMTPKTAENLDRFLSGFRRVGRYVIAPVHFRNAEGPLEIYRELGITKTTLIVREAWTIGENDQDLVGIRPNCEPIIPDGVAEAPVLKVLARRNRDSQAKTN